MGHDTRSVTLGIDQETCEYKCVRQMSRSFGKVYVESI